MISTRLTSLIVLLAAITCFVLAIWADLPEEYEARIYLAMLGLAFLAMGMVIEISGLLLDHQLRDERERAERSRRYDTPRQMPAPRDWPR